MSNLRDIKNRIGSVKKTQKITQAMKMVAAAKFKRLQHRLEQSTIYGHALKTIFGDLLTRLEPDELPSVLCSNTSSKEAVIIVTGDRGLCGGFNTSIIKKAQAYIDSLGKDSVDLYIIGNKASQFFKSKPYSISEMHTYFVDGVSESKVKTFLSPLIRSFESNDYNKVQLFYNEFVSALTNNQLQVQLLPIDLGDWTPSKTLAASDHSYEPSKPVVLEGFLSEYIVYNLYTALLSSHTAEEGARMAAMDSASENASDVIFDLTLQFNRSRQAAITTEISEIVAGAASLA